jgi:hypothetical protein
MNRVLSLGYRAARLPGFRAAPSLGYYIVAFLGYRVERGLGFMQRGVIIPDIIAQTQPSLNGSLPLSAGSPPAQGGSLLTFDFVRINREKPRNPIGHGLHQRLTSDQLEAA